MFAVPDDNPDAWRIPHDEAERALLTADPQAVVKRRTNRFRYQATLPFGWIEGAVTTSENCITISGATIDIATPFVTWLRTHLLGDAPITFNCAEGVEVEYPPGTLPTGIDETAIRSALTAHLEAVEDPYRS